MVQQNCQEETTEAGTTCGSEDLSGKLHNRKGLNQQEQMMTLKPRRTSGRCKVTSSIVLTLNLEFNYVPRDQTLPAPLKHIQTRPTFSNLDVLQEEPIDDCWNVDSNRCLSDSWTSRPENLWPEVWSTMGKAV